MAEQVTSDAKATAKKVLEDSNKLIAAAHEKAQGIIEGAQEAAAQAKIMMDKLEKSG